MDGRNRPATPLSSPESQPEILYTNIRLSTDFGVTGYSRIEVTSDHTRTKCTFPDSQNQPSIVKPQWLEPKLSRSTNDKLMTARNQPSWLILSRSVSKAHPVFPRCRPIRRCSGKGMLCENLAKTYRLACGNLVFHLRTCEHSASSCSGD